MRRTVAAMTLALLTGCGSSGPDSVDWENYAPTAKQRIDKAAKSRDCLALQSEFDTAEQNNTVQRNRTGDGNADLMAHIDTLMVKAGCHK